MGYPWAGNVKMNPALQMVADFGRNYKEYYNAKSDEKKEKYNDKVLKLLKRRSDEVVSEIAAKDKLSRELFENIISFRELAIFGHTTLKQIT